jgi:hypothetical protein
MPLHDHFRPPVSLKHHWSGLHGQWPGEIVRSLFDRLPAGYYAGPRVYLGSSFEVDIGVTEGVDRPAFDPGDSSGTATLTAVAPPFTAVADKLDFDDYEVRIYDDTRTRTLVAAIEIVSPSNKDRPETRTQFVSKCGALLREGVSVSIVDIVTDRTFNLYAELMGRVGQPDPRVSEDTPMIYAATLRGRRVKQQPLVDAWYFPLALGQPLPTIPIWLGPGIVIQLPLEPSYLEVCRLLRVP